MNIRFLFPALILFSILFVSCEADIDLQNVSDEISLYPDLVIPIGGTSITLGQFITNNDTLGEFEIGTNEEINYVILDSSEFNIPQLNLLENSRELIENQYPSPAGVLFIPPNSPLPPLSVNDSVQLGINSNPNGDRIDSTRVTSATFNVIVTVTPDMSTIPPSDLKFTLEFPI